MNRLAICLPQTENVKAEYATSLAGMMLRLGNVPCGMDDVLTVTGYGSVLPSVRQNIAQRAVESFNATHLLWIDSDHSFPADTAHRLIAHKKPWVGINATTRHHPIRFTAIDRQRKLVSTGHYEKGLEEVSRMGFGITLIRADVFTSIEKPWFMVEYVNTDDMGFVFRGEDVYFAEKAKARGFYPLVDHDLTKETAHIGSVGWTSTMLDEANQKSA